jgi:hypothetical protein
MTIYTTIFSIHSAYTNQNWAKPNLSNQTRGLSPLSLITLTEAYPFSSPSTAAGNSFPHNHRRDRPRLGKRNLPSLSSQPSLSFHSNRITKRGDRKWVFSLKLPPSVRDHICITCISQLPSPWKDQGDQRSRCFESAPLAQTWLLLLPCRFFNFFYGLFLIENNKWNCAE